MALFLIFVHILLPGVKLFPPELAHEQLSVDVPHGITANDLFDYLKNDEVAFPHFNAEAAEDLKDIADFYTRSLSELRGTKTRIDP